LCEAVPLTPANAAIAGDRCGQLLPLIGNARPRRAAARARQLAPSRYRPCERALECQKSDALAWHGNCS
jgi:hypothetical protein